MPVRGSRRGRSVTRLLRQAKPEFLKKQKQGVRFMSATTANTTPWWKEPTKDQWLAWVAAWLGWTLDSFDFTIFLLLMVPLAQDFNVPLVDVNFVFTVTLWMRLV